MDDVDAGSLTIALITACSEPEGPGVHSPLVQELLDEASSEPERARAVLATMLTASVVCLRAFTEATERDRQAVLHSLGVGWERRRLAL